MVDTFLLTSELEDPEDAEFVADYEQPRVTGQTRIRRRMRTRRLRLRILLTRWMPRLRADNVDLTPDMVPGQRGTHRQLQAHVTHLLAEPGLTPSQLHDLGDVYLVPVGCGWSLVRPDIVWPLNR